jgi:hypothetical protein
MLGIMGTYISRAPGVPTVASGQAAAPTAGQVIADTGALAAGIYDIEVTLGFSGAAAAGKQITVEHRNAANNANIQQYAMLPCPGAHPVYFARVSVAAGERIRAVIGAVAAAASEVAHATIRVHPPAA